MSLAVGQSYHHGDTRNACVEASLKLMKKGGVDAITLRKVADEVGVSRTAPYRHFADKRDLLAACAVKGFNILEEMVAKAVEKSGENPTDQLFAGSFAYAHFGASHPHLYRLMFSSDISDAEYPEIGAAGAAAIGVPMSCLFRAQEMGVMRKADIQMQAFALWSALHGVVMLDIGRPTQIFDTRKLDNNVKAILAILLEGLAT